MTMPWVIGRDFKSITHENIKTLPSVLILISYLISNLREAHLHGGIGRKLKIIILKA